MRLFSFRLTCVLWGAESVWERWAAVLAAAGDLPPPLLEDDTGTGDDGDEGGDGQAAGAEAAMPAVDNHREAARLRALLYGGTTDRADRAAGPPRPAAAPSVPAPTPARVPIEDDRVVAILGTGSSEPSKVRRRERSGFVPQTDRP